MSIIFQKSLCSGRVSSLDFVYVAVLVNVPVQIPVNKLGIHNNLKSYTFWISRSAPAGMPFMYTMTCLVSVPQLCHAFDLVYGFPMPSPELLVWPNTWYWEVGHQPLICGSMHTF